MSALFECELRFAAATAAIETKAAITDPPAISVQRRRFLAMLAPCSVIVGSPHSTLRQAETAHKGRGMTLWLVDRSYVIMDAATPRSRGTQEPWPARICAREGRA